MRNSNFSFSHNPSINIQRSRFNLNHRVKTGGIGGLLYPIGTPIEVLPGDTHQLKINTFARLNPMINVPLDDCFIDIYFFFVPNRIVWNHWKDFCGENNNTAWVQTTAYSVPKIKLNDYQSGVLSVQSRNPNSVLANFGVPYQVHFSDASNTDGHLDVVSALPLRGYIQIWNNYFRSEAVDTPLYEDLSDNDIVYDDSTALYGGTCLPVKRVADYFSTCLPAPQKGDPVKIPINTSSTDIFQVNGTSSKVGLKTGTVQAGTTGSIIGTGAAGTFMTANNYTLNPDLIGTINELRIAVQTQKVLEALAIYGSRYFEFLRGIFKVDAPSLAILQLPQYIGGKRIQVNMNSIIQNSSTTYDAQGGVEQPTGKVSGQSSTFESANIGIFSSIEHGYIIPLWCLRTARTYTQGMPKALQKFNFYDYYLPQMANIGNVPVYTKELYCDMVHPTLDKDVFGYQEAWDEYRYLPNNNVGWMSNVAGIGPYWSYADYYNAVPSLSSSWLNEGFTNLNRNMAIQYDSSAQTPWSTAPQVLIDFGIMDIATRPLPLYSVPGLMDHF